jgi:hypothetical protein
MTQLERRPRIDVTRRQPSPGAIEVSSPETIREEGNDSLSIINSVVAILVTLCELLLFLNLAGRFN